MRFLAVVGVALAGSVLGAGPASAAVRFDHATGTGFVGAHELRTAFRWDDAALRSRAGRVTFSQSRAIDETYEVTCGRRTVPVHRLEFMRMDLGATVVKGKRETITGFEITGPVSGASSTTAMPFVGGPCPPDAGPAAGKTVDAVRLVSATTTRKLTAHFRKKSRDLLTTGGAGAGARGVRGTSGSGLPG